MEGPPRNRSATQRRNLGTDDAPIFVGSHAAEGLAILNFLQETFRQLAIREMRSADFESLYDMARARNRLITDPFTQAWENTCDVYYDMGWGEQDNFGSRFIRTAVFLIQRGEIGTSFWEAFVPNGTNGVNRTGVNGANGVNRPNGV